MLINISKNKILDFILNGLLIIFILWISFKTEMLLFTILNIITNKSLTGILIVNLLD